MATSEDIAEISAKPARMDERYESATHTSNLHVDTRDGSPIRAVDILTSAGMMQCMPDGKAPPPWSALRTGMALLRLASEWDGAAKPRRPGNELYTAMLTVIKAEDAQYREQTAGKIRALEAKLESTALSPDDRADLDQRKERLEALALLKPVPALIRATERAQRWYTSELRLLAQSLKSRADVWTQLENWRLLRGVDSETVAAALLHWLSPTCPICEGRGYRKLPDAPANSARPCRECDGLGQRRRPQGTSIVLNYFDNALQRARTSLTRRLRRE